MEYHFQGAARWSFGLATPNYAGALFAMLLPWIWSLGQGRKNPLARLGAPLVTLGVGFLIGKTGSRGAEVAAVFGCVLFFLAKRKQRPATWANDSGQMFMLLGAFLLGVAFSGMLARALPAYVQQDASIGNRLTLWCGALRMIAVSPAGWGWQMSGFQYGNWFQNTSDTLSYSGMVSLHLQIAVEFGLITAVGWALVQLLPSVWMLSAAILPESVCAAATATAIFSVAQIFSTLGEEPLLWIFYCANLFWVLAAFFPKRAPWPRWRSFVASGALAMIFLGVMYGAGKILVHSSPITVSQPQPGWLRLTTEEGRSIEPEVAVILDPRDFGNVPGHAIRRLFAQGECRSLWVSLWPQKNQAIPAGVKRVIASGRACHTLGPGSASVSMIHPAGRVASRPGDSVILPEHPGFDSLWWEDRAATGRVHLSHGGVIGDAADALREALSSAQRS
jgi:hypothetical protein